MLSPQKRTRNLREAKGLRRPARRLFQPEAAMARKSGSGFAEAGAAAEVASRATPDLSA